MNRKVLFVDDQVEVTSSYKRLLRQHFEIHTAASAEEALTCLRVNKDTPYAVIVSDFKMPGMDGLDFLKEAKEISPDTTRVLLTGYADTETAATAINEGAIFRFLSKPCPTKEMITIINDCIQQHHLLISEKELLRGTLQGSLKVLSDILAVSNPDSFGQGERIKKIVSYLLKKVPQPNSWQIEIAAMLSQIGSVALPPQIVSVCPKKEFFL